MAKFRLQLSWVLAGLILTSVFATAGALDYAFDSALAGLAWVVVFGASVGSVLVARRAR